MHGWVEEKSAPSQKATNHRSKKPQTLLFHFHTWCSQFTRIAATRQSQHALESNVWADSVYEHDKFAGWRVHDVHSDCFQLTICASSQLKLWRIGFFNPRKSETAPKVEIQQILYLNVFLRIRILCKIRASNEFIIWHGKMLSKRVSNNFCLPKGHGLSMIR